MKELPLVQSPCVNSREESRGPDRGARVPLAKCGTWDQPRVALEIGGETLDTPTYLSCGRAGLGHPQNYPSLQKGIWSGSRITPRLHRGTMTQLRTCLATRWKPGSTLLTHAKSASGLLTPARRADQDSVSA